MIDPASALRPARNGPGTRVLRRARPRPEPRGPGVLGHRVRLDGKAFTRDGRRFQVCGVTYGPFAPNGADEPFPAEDQARADFAHMRAIGVNSVRTYHLPPDWFLRLADDEGMAVFIDIPWAKHTCFLES